MGLIETVVEAVAALFLIWVFLSIILPTLSQATGANTSIFAIALILLAIGVIASVFRSR